MNNDDVENLYRCLLGRAPESADTIAAFKVYYGEFPRGRAAILQSAEFSTLFADIAGNAQATLAHAFLRRAGGTTPPNAHPANPDLAGAMRLMLRVHAHVHLAVVVGATELDLADLLPLDSARPAILHIAPHHPAFIPQIGALPNGATIFRIQFDPPGLHDFLRAAELRIDILALLHDPAPWLAALRPVIAARAILLGPPELGAATDGWPHIERTTTIANLTVRPIGGWFLPVTYMPPPDCAPPPEDAPKLWLAAIMRNEADSIVNMLQSIAPIAAGFVLLDTGSTDDTQARARAYLETLDKPFILQCHAADRFDTMRNAALDLVPPEADWVLMLDADEELCQEDHAALLDLLRTAKHEAYALPRYNYPGRDKSGEVTPYPDRQVRLLRQGCTPAIRYTGAVHEKILDVDIGLLPLDAGILGQGSGGPHIHHLVRRFRSPDAESAKQHHYRAIAERYN